MYTTIRSGGSTVPWMPSAGGRNANHLPASDCDTFAFLPLYLSTITHDQDTLA